MSTIEFWSIQNTGWSGGVSWFDIGGSETNPMRFDNKYDAFSYADKLKTALNQDTTMWRVVHTTIERKEFQETITKKWTLL